MQQSKTCHNTPAVVIISERTQDLREYCVNIRASFGGWKDHILPRNAALRGVRNS